jgi:hypothetical protein
VKYGEAERLRIRHSIRPTANRQRVHKAVAKSWKSSHECRSYLVPAACTYPPIDSPASLGVNWPSCQSPASTAIKASNNCFNSFNPETQVIDSWSMTAGRGKGRTLDLTKNSQSRHRVLSYSATLYRALGAHAGHEGSTKSSLTTSVALLLIGRGYLLARFLHKLSAGLP